MCAERLVLNSRCPQVFLWAHPLSMTGPDGRAMPRHRASHLGAQHTEVLPSKPLRALCCLQPSAQNPGVEFSNFHNLAAVYLFWIVLPTAALKPHPPACYSHCPQATWVLHSIALCPPTSESLPVESTHRPCEGLGPPPPFWELLSVPQPTVTTLL